MSKRSDTMAPPWELRHGDSLHGFELSAEYLEISRRRLREVESHARRGGERAGQASRFATEPSP